ncbi:MAG TPA: glycosyltransferase family 1 protein [Dehalococcoidia bacterium]|nr:glycosyltransferase family 1 protein [Dehalococcoidia bacterium]
MIKVLGLALYGDLAASNRYRLGQYVDGFSEFDIDLQVFPLLGNDYLRWKFFNNGNPPIVEMFRDGIRRLRDLRSTKKFDLAILHCELFPLMPGMIERLLIRLPYIYDFDDAMYLKYRKGSFGLTNKVLANKFDSLMAGAELVTAGNRVLGDYASKVNSNVCIMPTVVDINRYIPTNRKDSDTFTIGWIGSPSTSLYLSSLVEPLSKFGLETTVKLVVVGGKAPVVTNVEVKEVEWNENTELGLINSFDVGVMPLPNDDWSRGKCAFKLIQYMACSVPVIASPVGANLDVVTSDCGLFAETADDWIMCFRELLKHPSKRLEMGQASRKRIVEYYSLQRNLPVFADRIHRVASETRRI